MSTVKSFRFNRTVITVEDDHHSPDMKIGIDIGESASLWERIKMSCLFMIKGYYVSVPFNFTDKDFVDFSNLIKSKKFKRNVNVFNVEKVFDDAFIPTRAHPSDSGWDVMCPYDVVIQPKDMTLIDLGIRINISSGYEIQARSRSGIATKYNTMLVLGVGTIDEGFRGSVRLPMYNFGDNPIQFKRGSRIAQLVIKRTEPIILKEGKVNMDTDRGEGGFGSSGV